MKMRTPLRSSDNGTPLVMLSEAGDCGDRGRRSLCLFLVTSTQTKQLKRTKLLTTNILPTDNCSTSLTFTPNTFFLLVN